MKKYFINKMPENELKSLICKVFYNNENVIIGTHETYKSCDDEEENNSIDYTIQISFIDEESKEEITAYDKFSVTDFDIDCFTFSLTNEEISYYRYQMIRKYKEDYFKKMIEVLKTESLSDAIYYLIALKMDSDIIIPALDVELCHEALLLVGKKMPTGKGEERIKKEIRKVQLALNKDERFEKFKHITGMVGYEVR